MDGYLNERGLPEPPAAGSEVDTLLGSLERQRVTFAWKCGGLDAAGLNVRLGPSILTLGGLLKHVALVESTTFLWTLHGRSPGAPWAEIDWDNDPDWEWRTAVDDSPEQLFALWEDAVSKARSAIDEALADGGLDHPVAQGWPDGRTRSLRRLLIDTIEEYARHAGHADLIRESVDGLVGEDPPSFDVGNPSST